MMKMSPVSVVMTAWTLTAIVITKIMMMVMMLLRMIVKNGGIEGSGAFDDHADSDVEHVLSLCDTTLPIRATAPASPRLVT